ncbi:MAG: hypothetical protein Q8736_02625, partial [Sweet potato little leaf phytoplasma]|nr:hypothetical protein [Sweet potato little leaf phytoplasma]
VVFLVFVVVVLKILFEIEENLIAIEKERRGTRGTSSAEQRKPYTVAHSAPLKREKETLETSSSSRGGEGKQEKERKHKFFSTIREKNSRERDKEEKEKEIKAKQH